MINSNEFLIRSKIDNILTENNGQISFDEIIITILEEDIFFSDFDLVEKIFTEYNL